jgi:AraC family ethanolamine operon transcriptional activator
VRTFGLYGKGSPGQEWRDREGRPDEIVVFPSNDEFDAVSQPGFFGDTVSVVEDRVRAVAEILELPDPLADLPVGRELIEADPGLVESIRAGLDAVHEIAFSSEARIAGTSTWAEAEFELVACVVRGLCAGAGSDGPAPERDLRHRALSRALDYIEEWAALAPTVEEICHASGASWRTLDYAFKDRFDLTPKQYLHAVRLQGVRRELLIFRGREPISAVALRWGFWHMSQFAADYRRTFGELPSETVRGS